MPSSARAIRTLIFGPDARVLIIGGDPTAAVILVDPSKPRQHPPGYPPTLAGHTAVVETLASSTQSMVLTSGSYDGTIRLWHE